MSAQPPVQSLPRWTQFVWLPLAALFLAFTNGRWGFGLASWLAPLCMVCFLRLQPLARGLPIGLAVQIGAYWIAWKEIIPAPGALYYVIATTYALLYFVPLLLDRTLAARTRSFASTLLLPTSWIVVELLIQRWTPYGSWASIGYSQAGWLALLQVASIFGIAGVSFVVVGTASIAAWALCSDASSSARRRGAWVGASCLLLLLVWGQVRIARAPRPIETVRVAMLTPLDQATRDLERSMRATSANPAPGDSAIELLRGMARRLNEDLLQRSREQARAGAQIVVWSEHAGRALASEENHDVDAARALAREEDVFLFIGMGVWHPQSHPPLENKVVAIRPDGSVAWQHRKARPIVGAESALLAPGHDVVPTLDTPYGTLSAVICHDLDFPELILRAGRAGVDLMLAPSADWPDIASLHATMAIARAVENGMSLVRPAHAGVSLAVDPLGRVLASAYDLAVADGTVVAHVPLFEMHTWYPLWGRHLLWVALLSLAIVIAIVRRAATEHAGRPSPQLAPRTVEARFRME